MTPKRRLCLFACLLFVSAAFLPAYGQEAPLNGFDDYVNKAFSVEAAPPSSFTQFELAGGKVKSLTLIQGSAPNLVLLPKQ